MSMIFGSIIAGCGILLVVVAVMTREKFMGPLWFGSITCVIVGLVLMLMTPVEDRYEEICLNGTTYYQYSTSLAPKWVDDKLVRCKS